MEATQIAVRHANEGQPAKMMSMHRDSSGGVKGGIVLNLEEVLAEVLRTCLEILKTC